MDSGKKLTITGVEAEKLRESIAELEDEIEKSEPIQRMRRVNEAMEVWLSGVKQELRKRGYDDLKDVDSDDIRFEILNAAGPMPDIANI
ncbi:hypothetical protein IR012_10610 [Pseudomonas putida]|uniref:hypothetical protein n=1 Tax=Pseudomonas putida TaxID=303 RepID=UPI0018AAD29A|nr:hypothetical protein [Pseudomonas putida]MBF8669659.1 hypothetical protein [Pseudomonas putida]MBF8712761.1 hypothetical protein [Pseudomonas putida]